MQIANVDLRLRHLVATAAPLAMVAAAIVLSSRIGDRLTGGLEGVSAAQPGLLWLGGLAFVAALVCSGLAWRSALSACAADVSRADACGCYLAGSLVNSTVPAKLGGALRIGLFSRRIDREGAIFTASGAAGAIAAARAFWSCILISVGAAVGTVPVWPALTLGAVVAGAALAAILSRRLRANRRIAHLLDVFRAIGACPRRGVPILAWSGLAQLLRYGAATALLAAFAIPCPFLAALLVIPAVGLAGSLPLMPGNVGVASAAATMALSTLGVPSEIALSTGIAYGGVELLASIVAGSLGALSLVRAPGIPRRLALGATAAGTLVVASAFGATVLVPAVQFAL